MSASLRDYFAAHAMRALVQRESPRYVVEPATGVEGEDATMLSPDTRIRRLSMDRPADVARLAYDMADAMVTEKQHRPCPLCQGTRKVKLVTAGVDAGEKVCPRCKDTTP